jgi:hypothetical protein
MTAALPSLRLPFWDAAAVPPIGTGSYPCKLCSGRVQVLSPTDCNRDCATKNHRNRTSRWNRLSQDHHTKPSLLIHFPTTPRKGALRKSYGWVTFRRLNRAGQTSMDTLADNRPLSHKQMGRRPKPGLKDRISTRSQPGQPPTTYLPDDGYAKRLPKHQQQYGIPRRRPGQLRIRARHHSQHCRQLGAAGPHDQRRVFSLRPGILVTTCEYRPHDSYLAGTES